MAIEICSIRTSLPGELRLAPHALSPGWHTFCAIVIGICSRAPDCLFAQQTVSLQEAQLRPDGPQKVIVFSAFVQALHLRGDILAKNNLGFVMLQGKMELDERSQVCVTHLCCMSVPCQLHQVLLPRSCTQPA